MPDERLGALYRQGGLMRVDNGRVEKVLVQNRSRGALLLSYAVPGPGSMLFVEQLRLNIGPNTLVLNAFGRPICFCNLRPGTWVDAIFSPQMTRSLPPQSIAFLIRVQQATQSPAFSQITTGPVAFVDPEHQLLTLGDPRDINRQTRFVLTDTTVIAGRGGVPIPLSNLRPGQQVRVIHSTAQTASIPPQSAAYYVQLL